MPPRTPPREPNKTMPSTQRCASLGIRAAEIGRSSCMRRDVLRHTVDARTRNKTQKDRSVDCPIDHRVFEANWRWHNDESPAKRRTPHTP